VYLGLNADTGELFAVKEVEVNELDHGACEAAQQLEREVQLLTKLQHPNIVRYIGTARDDGETGGGDTGDDGGNGGGRTHTRTRRSLFIFLEYVPGGSIAGLLMRFGPLEVSVIAVYLSQILVGLDYLHSRNVAHRDVKGANILVDTNGRVKLADFGAAKTLVAKVKSLQKERDVSFHEHGDKLGGEEHGTEGDTHTTQKISGNTNSKHDAENNTASASAMAGSAYWMAPEVVRRSGSGTPADVWSVGCVLIEMATGNHPWFGCGGQAQAIYKIAGTNELPGFPNTFCVSGRDFVFMCLRRSPGERPSAAELLTHPFVADAGGSLGKHGSVPALRYEYADPEDWVGGGDELHGETVTRGEELTDRELALPDALESVPRDAYHLQKDQLVGTADLKNFRRELPASQSGSIATAPAKETTRNHEEPLPDWRVEVEAMRLRFADDDDDTDEVGDPGGWVRGTKEGGGSRPPETRKPASAMPRPPTLAGVG
jgi:mitogen-activated protein kinase kinase kinase|tara:strand:+ start:222 stop:1682 length:1461 start_codon:yes stop_codon:yes gene_type:complete